MNQTNRLNNNQGTLSFFKCYGSLMLLYTYLALVNCILEICICKKVQKIKILERSVKIGRRYLILNYKKQRHDVAEVWMPQHMNDINFLFIKSQACFFFNAIHMLALPFPYLGPNCPCELCLSMQIQIIMLVSKSVIFDKPTKKS